MIVYKSALAMEYPEIGYTLYTTNKSNTMVNGKYRDDIWFECTEAELDWAKASGAVYETYKGDFVAVAV